MYVYRFIGGLVGADEAGVEVGEPSHRHHACKTEQPQDHVDPVLAEHLVEGQVLRDAPVWPLANACSVLLSLLVLRTQFREL